MVVAIVDADTAYHGMLLPPRKKSRVFFCRPLSRWPTSVVPMIYTATTAQSQKPNIDSLTSSIRKGNMT